MKTALSSSLLYLILLTHPCQSAELRMKPFGPAWQFVYFAVIEGCYRDGVTNEDLDRILAKTGNLYTNFIYACPICSAASNGFRTYRERPEFFGFKNVSEAERNRTFGKGLPEELRDALASADAATRLRALHTLISKWCKHRFDHETNPAEAEALQKELEAGRKEGAEILAHAQKLSDPTERVNYRLKLKGQGMSDQVIEASLRSDLSGIAPGYAGIKECAACAGATMKPFGK